MEYKEKQIQKEDTKKHFPDRSNVTSPLSASKLVAKVNMLTATSTPTKSSDLPTLIGKSEEQAQVYKQLMDGLSSILPSKDVTDFYLKIHKLLTGIFSCSFTGFGIFNEISGSMNLKLIDKMDNSYVSKVFKLDIDNPVMKAYLEKKMILDNNVSFLSLTHFRNHPVTMIPMISATKCIGVMIVSDISKDSYKKLLSFIANYTAAIIDNFNLIEVVYDHINTDSLTQLYNHRGFQENLANELENAETFHQDLSIVMLDVNNITKINRELGHAKGDEVIKLVAEKVKHNIRKSDIAGRYGGDEIALILPNTNIDEAKYIAEYITYSLSCCFVDDVGPVKVSVGISTYPTCAKDREKLLILAEQAMYISQAKGYKDGMSAIISSSDFNFWDDVALSSYAEVLTKRHAQMGVNFEEELLKNFHNEQNYSMSHISEIATSLAGAIDAKDPYTKGHSTSVSRYSEALARAVNLPENEVKRIALGALLHDVGKIGIPEAVLKKPSKLSDEEWNIMKQHPVIGAEKVLEPNESLRDLIPIVKYHHERIDGLGYPEKLSGDQIPLSAKIVAVADAFHALISDRPYRKGLSIDTACDILVEGAGKQWDTNLIRKFIQIAPSLSNTI